MSLSRALDLSIKINLMTQDSTPTKHNPLQAERQLGEQLTTTTNLLINKLPDLSGRLIAIGATTEVRQIPNISRAGTEHPVLNTRLELHGNTFWLRESENTTGLNIGNKSSEREVRVEYFYNQTASAVFNTFMGRFNGQFLPCSPDVYTFIAQRATDGSNCSILSVNYDEGIYSTNQMIITVDGEVFTVSNFPEDHQGSGAVMWAGEILREIP
jgi:hypothetical protein